MCKLHFSSTEPKPPGLWDSPSLAAYLGCSQRHLFNLRKRGLPAYRLGDAVRFDIEQVIAWLNSSTSASPASPNDSRRQQLADLASEDTDNAACATADLQREFPQHP